MRALIQRVKEAHVTVDGAVTGRIGPGMLVFVGVTHGDTSDDAAYLAQRCADIRIFQDAEGKMNLALPTAGGQVLAVSQFTLYADTARGNRPGFTQAAPPEQAERLYDEFVLGLRSRLGAENVQTGVFRAMMDVALVNDGPVTLMLESKH